MTLRQRQAASLRGKMLERSRYIIHVRDMLNQAIEQGQWSEAELHAEELHKAIRDQNTTENLLADIS
jgi:hypothetical protein